MKRRIFLSLSLLCVYLSLPTTAAAQQKCQLPIAPIAPSGQNIFSEQQEMDLGDAVAEHVQRDYHVIDDGELTSHLRMIGERLTKQLPPTSLRFQFFLFDVNDVNAFTLPGGRIYVSRKLVAFAKTEDELAGVIAHELGHIIARHSTIEMTNLFRDVLGITQVTDRRDIFAKYNQLIENAARKPKAFEKRDDHESGDQNFADLIGLYALSRAGYDPQAQAGLWDRLFELKGKTGGFLADLFGRTKPEQKRLREMLRGLALLPAECVGTRIAANPEQFQQWQAAVVSYSGLGRKESLRGLTLKQSLNPALRSDINHLRFSPDGKFILAQDDSGINVLSRQPLGSLFRIHAPDAQPAQFSPDSRQIVFHTSNMRVEIWDIAEQKLHSAREAIIRKLCLQTALSPDGNTLACLDSDYGLSLIDVQTGNPLFEKKSFSQMGYYDALALLLYALVASEDFDLGDREYVSMSFSPDGRYFLAGDRATSFNALGWSTEIHSLVFDVTTRTTVPIKGDLKNVLSSGFVFVGADKIVGHNFENGKKAGLYSFPGGQAIEQFQLAGSIKPVTAGNYVLLSGFGSMRGALMDLTTKKLLQVNKRPVLDAYQGTMAFEQRNGEVALYDLNGGAPAGLPLPQNPLGRIYAADITPDFKWLAISGYSRGAVWDLTQGKMVFYVRGFRGAYIGEDGIVYADFPKLDQVERNIAQLNIATKDTNSGATINDEGTVKQFGAFAISIKQAKKDSSYWENVTMEVLDVRTMSPLWSIPFPKERPWYWVAPRHQTITLLWTARSKAAAAEIKDNPVLQRQMEALKEKEGDYLIKTLDIRTGKPLGELMVETGKGSFRIKEVFTSGDWVVIGDTQNRVLIYSLSDGRQAGKVFGKRPTISVASNLLCVETEDGMLAIYDLATFEKREQFTFSGPISMTRFSPDGKRLFVLTASQSIYQLDVSVLAGPKS